MKKLILSAVLSALCAGAFAAEHEIKMLTSGKDGTMVFEPAFLKVAKGDKVKFIKGDMSHNSTALLVPAGAAAWKGKMDEEVSVTLDREGVYIYACDPHKVMAMAGVIQVGKATNLSDARKEADKISGSFVMNKDRLAKLIEQVK